MKRGQVPPALGTTTQLSRQMDDHEEATFRRAYEDISARLHELDRLLAAGLVAEARKALESFILLHDRILNRMQDARIGDGWRELDPPRREPRCRSPRCVDAPDMGGRSRTWATPRRLGIQHFPGCLFRGDS